MLNSNFSVFAGWPGKEYLLKFLKTNKNHLLNGTPSQQYTSKRLKKKKGAGLLSKGAVTSSDLGLPLQTTPLPRTAGCCVSMARLGSGLSTHLWSVTSPLTVTLSDPIPFLCTIRHLAGLAKQNAGLGRGEPPPNLCASQVPNMTLMESKGQDNPDQSSCKAVWWQKGKYTQL